jgi:hypothetical protein
MPAVWALASDTGSTVAGTARPRAAATPKNENASRREIFSDAIFPLMQISGVVKPSGDPCSARTAHSGGATLIWLKLSKQNAAIDTMV